MTRHRQPDRRRPSCSWPAAGRWPRQTLAARPRHQPGGRGARAPRPTPARSSPTPGRPRRRRRRRRVPAAAARCPAVHVWQRCPHHRREVRAGPNDFGTRPRPASRPAVPAGQRSAMPRLRSAAATAIVMFAKGTTLVGSSHPESFRPGAAITLATAAPAAPGCLTLDRLEGDCHVQYTYLGGPCPCGELSPAGRSDHRGFFNRRRTRGRRCSAAAATPATAAGGGGGVARRLRPAHRS